MSKSMDWNEYFMRHVYLAASKSKDPRTKIGAVLVKQNRIISEGYNGLPQKVCDAPFRLERPLKYSYVVHGEHNAVLSCARFGISAQYSTCYTQGIPCCDCMKALIQAGVNNIVVHKQWPNLTHSEQWVKSVEISKEMADEAGIIIEVYDQDLKLNGWLDGKEIAV